MQYSILLILGGTCSATVETWHWYPSFWAAPYFERDNWNSLFRRFNQGWSDWFAFYIVITSDNDPLLAFRELTLVNAIGWIKKKCFTVQFNLNNSDWLRAMLSYDQRAFSVAAPRLWNKLPLKFELVLMLIFLNLSWKRFFLKRYMTFSFIIFVFVFFPF